MKAPILGYTATVVMILLLLFHITVTCVALFFFDICFRSNNISAIIYSVLVSLHICD